MRKFGVLKSLGFLALVFSQVNGNLLCYSCSPTTHSVAACSHPASYLTPVNCSSRLVGHISNYRFGCYSEFLNYNNVSSNGGWNQTGMYRGCAVYTVNSPKVNQCATALPVNVTRMACSSCSSSRCNTQSFTFGWGAAGDEVGGAVIGGRASAIIPSIFILIICVLVLYMKNS